MQTMEGAELEMQGTVAEKPVDTFEKDRARLHLFPILALTLVVRFALVFMLIRRGRSEWFFDQATELTELAKSLLSGHGLSAPFGGATGPSAFLTPGYPAIVAVVFRFFGESSTNSAIALIMLQMLFNIATVVVILLVARRAFGVREANLAGVIWAISPVTVWLPTLYWETSLSILALISIITLALRCAARPTTLRWVSIGLCCGLTLLVNPSLALALAAVVAWTAYRTRRITRSGPAIAVFLCLLVFAPWPVRNLYTMHAFIPFRTNLGYELWQGNQPESKGFFNPALHMNASKTEFSRYAALGELGYMHEKSLLAQNAIRANPVRFIRLSIKRFGCFWAGISDRNFSFLVSTHIILTTLLGIAGLSLLFRRRHSTALLFALPLLLFPLPYYFTHADPRFRLVVDPIAIILSAYAIIALTDRSKRGHGSA